MYIVLVLTLFIHLSFLQEVNIFAGTGLALPSYPYDGAFLSAEFNSPQGMVGIRDGIILCDAETNRIRFLNFSNEIVTTIVGDDIGIYRNGNFSYASFDRPYSIDVYNSTLYVVDHLSIRKITNFTSKDDGFVSDITTPPLEYVPYGSTFDDEGNFYVISDRTIELIDFETKTSTTIVGSLDFDGYDDGVGLAARFTSLRDIMYLGGYFYVVDSGNHNVRKVEVSSRTVTTFLGSTTGESGYNEGIGTGAKFNYPSGLVNIMNEFFLITDLNNHVIRMVDLALSQTSLFIGEAGMFGMGSGDQQAGPIPRIYAPTKLLTKEELIYFGTDSNYIYEVNGKPKVVDDLILTNIREYSVYTEWTMPISGGFNITYINFMVRALNNPEFETRYYNVTVIDSLLLDGLTQNTTFEVTIQAQNIMGNSPISTPVRFTTKIGCNGVLSTNTSFVCSNHGDCVKPETCECHPDFAGSDCEYFNCYGFSAGDSSYVCSSRGSCVSPHNCSCEEGYAGLECEFATCFGYNSSDERVCSGHGNCSAYNNCSCPEDEYDGDRCQYNVCFTISESDVANVCSGHGDCASPDNCTCHPHHFGPDCAFPECYGENLFHADASQICSGRGDCTSVDTCDCDENYGGFECQFPVCFNITANQEGSCNYPNGNCTDVDTCTCSTGYVGQECQYPLCYGYNSTDLLKVCSTHGNCTSVDTCSCDDGYAGDECQYYSCFGVSGGNTSFVCSEGHGNCTHTDTCTCAENYFGSECEVTTCYSSFSNLTSTCSGKNGNCTDYDTCTCDDFHDGERCEYYTCFGIIHWNDTYTCSGHGNCSFIDSCDCDENYFGTECEVTTCHGKWNNVSSNQTGEEACGGITNGECSTFDRCDCRTGYIGQECEVVICNSIFSNVTEQVCSGHGNCTDFDFCECETNYDFSQFCDVNECFGILSNNPSVCNDQSGVCTGYDVCECFPGWMGQSCSIYECYGVEVNDSSVCSGNGNCTGGNACDCDEGWTGLQCDLPGTSEIIDPNPPTVNFALIFGASGGSLVLLLFLLCCCLCSACFCLFLWIVFFSCFLCPGCLGSSLCPGLSGVGLMSRIKRSQKSNKIVPLDSSTNDIPLEENVKHLEDEEVESSSETEGLLESMSSSGREEMYIIEGENDGILEKGDGTIVLLETDPIAIPLRSGVSEASDVQIEQQTVSSVARSVEELFLNLTDWNIPLDLVVKPPVIRNSRRYISN